MPVTENHDLVPVSPYGLSKLSVEHLARIYGRQHGLRIACLRYFTVYGPRQRPDMAFSRFLRAALAGDKLRILGDGTQSRDFTFVADAVSATILALDAPAGIYNVGGGEPVSLNDGLEAQLRWTPARGRPRLGGVPG